MAVANVTSLRRAQQSPMDLLRFATAGSVDDGKSTLIGRLLYDSKSILADQLAHVRGGLARAGGDGTRPRAAHRRPARRARAGHHDRRRLPLLRDARAQVHHRRHARARAVHAQHGHGRLDGRPRARPRRRPQGRGRAERRHAFIASLLRHPAHRRVREQDGPRRLGRGALRRASSRSSPPSPPRSTCADLHLHPDQRAARRQRRRALRAHALVPGPDAAAPPRARPHRLRPQPRPTRASPSSG